MLINVLLIKKCSLSFHPAAPRSCETLVSILVEHTRRFNKIMGFPAFLLDVQLFNRVWREDQARKFAYYVVT